MSDVLPPDKVFLIPRMPLSEMRAWETLYGFKEFSFPEKGFFSHYEGHLEPSKGMAYTAASEANNVMKRVSISMVLMLKPTPTNFLTQFKRLADYLYAPHYLHLRYYNDCSRELFETTYRFLRKLGFGFDLSYGLGRIVASLFEYDNGYRFRVEDIFTETNKEKLLANPHKELKRLEKIYVARETYADVGQRAKLIFRLLRLALLIPSVKTAFKFAIRESDFKNFQLDKIETYWSNRRGDYDFGGVPYGIRQLKQGFKFYV